MSRTWDAVATELVRGDALSRYAYLLTGSVDSGSPVALVSPEQAFIVE